MRAARLAPVLWLAAASLAAPADPRGWSPGRPAEGAAQVLAGPGDSPLVAFPDPVLSRVERPTLLFYFSPTCPHCQRVAGEVEALHRRLGPLGASVLGVASGGARAGAIGEFRAEYGVSFEILHDTDGAILGALSARSTPSAMLVAPASGKAAERGKLRVIDLWYPYLPGWDLMVEGRVRGDLWAAFRPGEYQGTGACASCHRQEHASWRLTHHAIAWHTLEEAGKDQDPACVGCHVTGQGQPTGHGSGAPTDLVDVGCEACHGPGGPHDGERVDARTTCVGCHDAKHSVAFTVEKGLPFLDHYLAGHLSEAEREERERALWKGEAPQALLAFPEGANVGSAKCRSCHPAEHDQWADSPHARGMDSLRAEGSGDPACVRCHATAKTSGPAPQTLAGFDTLGGVGCESCHGPGERHVAAGGGKDNILGLGESCPVCVIEALCTSCHTPKWSPEWSLEPALEAVRHRPAD